MSAELDPSKLALVHDKLNDQMIDLEPERHGTDYKAGIATLVMA